MLVNKKRHLTIYRQLIIMMGETKQKEDLD